MEAIFPSLVELENKVKQAADEIKRLRSSREGKMTDETKATMKKKIEKIIKLIEEVE